MLTIIETHPVQYHAPVYRAVQARYGVPVSVVYGSDFSVTGYRDEEFQSTFSWDTDLLSGYKPYFLQHAHQPATASTRRLGRALQELQPKAIMLVGYSPRFHQLAFVRALQTRLPILFRAETTDHAVARRTIKRCLRDWALRFLYGNCSRLLYVGQNSRRHFQRLGCPEQKLVFSPYCVDTSVFALDEGSRTRLRASTRQALEIRPEECVVLLSGKLVHRKRPDLVLRAIRMLPRERRERIHVLALGSGDLQSDFEALARQSPQIRVSCIGFKNQTQLSAYYHAADVLVLASESSETWGLVVNEALHHGLPCVVSDAVGSAPDLIQPGVTGEVFAAGSAPSLADALQRTWRLITGPTIRDACHRVVSQYTVDKAAEGIAHAYFAVAAGA